ncbi:MAG: helix-hairpin-helix domain-containing protein [Promethearchaeota archaeon]
MSHVPIAARVAAVKGDLTVIKGIGPSAAEKLKNTGINTVAQLANKTPNQLSKIKGIGLETAKNMINSARESEKNAIKLEKEVVIEGVEKSLTVKPRKEVLAVGIDSFIAKPKGVVINEGKENKNKKEKEKEKTERRIEPELEVEEIFCDEGQEYGVNALIKEPKKKPDKIFTEKEREKEEKEEEKKRRHGTGFYPSRARNRILSLQRSNSWETFRKCRPG